MCQHGSILWPAKIRLKLLVTVKYCETLSSDIRSYVASAASEARRWQRELPQEQSTRKRRDCVPHCPAPRRMHRSEVTRAPHRIELKLNCPGELNKMRLSDA